MRRAAAIPLSIVSAVLAGATSAACFDLFHSTADILTACEIDAGNPLCRPAAGADAAPPTDFCAWSPAQARDHARHTCAWLGACESPMGGNALGPCMFQALLAYDCAANPNHRPKGQALQIWDCLWQAQTCDDVARCVLPDGAPTCATPGTYATCAAPAGVSAGESVRLACGPAQSAGPVAAENCALWGQTCATDGKRAACAGDSTGLTCSQSECFGTQLHWCDGGDIGIDCASNGAQRCDGFPSTSQVQWVACVAESDAGACPPDPTARCSGGRARSCPSGVVETVDCAALLGTPDACVSGRLSPDFDWTSPCSLAPPACEGDRCADGGAIGCARGAPFAVDCAAEQLGECRMVGTDLGTAQHAACAPP
jgi:hypothetical protein